MSYTLYIGENCHQCEEVVQFLEGSDVTYNLVNVDKSVEQPPIDLFAYPALFKEETLLCYGTDILDHFS